MTITDTDSGDADRSPFAEWVVLELMGHRRLAGHLTEQEIAGKGFLRLDIPAGRDGEDGAPAATQLYNPTSVYAITPTTEAIARAVAAGARPAPVHRWELAPAAPLTEHGAGGATGLGDGIGDDDEGGPF